MIVDPTADDLSRCDREPIERPGAVQSFGFLLVIAADFRIVGASENVERFVGRPAAALFGRPLNEVFSREAVHDLRNRLLQVQGTVDVERVFCLDLLGRGGETPFDCAIHYSGDHAIIEAEPSHPAATTEVAGLIRSMTKRLDRAPDLDRFLHQGARQMQLLTGFDRVMAYRFHDDASGEVVAEVVRPGVDPLRGLHFPATDIPRQARALYLRNPFRIICDVEQAPVPIVTPRPGGGTGIDLSSSVLRAVSPIHVQYLRNMGVAASLSVSIISEGRLWGLFACHHFNARCLPFGQRTLIELFGEILSLRLEKREREMLAARQATARKAGDDLLSAVAAAPDLFAAPERVMAIIEGILPCDGVAVHIGGRSSRSGIVPPVGRVASIARHLRTAAPGLVFATEQLGESMPEACDDEDGPAGLLAIPISAETDDYVMLFRRERIRSVTWAGDPRKPIHPDGSGPGLSPRASFAAWKEEVRGRSEPFTASERATAETLRVAIIEVVLRLAGAAGIERTTAMQRQELLIAELNHRVRNILTLIGALIAQSRDDVSDGADRLATLEARVLALGRAHDQITRHNWGPADLRQMIEAHGAQYAQSCEFVLHGEPTLLDPRAFSTLSLVLHEMLTNSCKYGAISAQGRIAIEWEVNPTGELVLRWDERGGPAPADDRRRGLGSAIIEQSVPHDLGGLAELSYSVSGTRARFVIPARFVSTGRRSTPAAAAEQVAVGAPSDDIARLELDGPVLLVEDSIIIAVHVDGLLSRIGIEDVVIVSNARDAMEEAAASRPAVAILDYELGEHDSIPVADWLLEHHIPYLFATGYHDTLKLPDRHAGTPILQKPYNEASLRASIEVIMRSSRSDTGGDA